MENSSNYDKQVYIARDIFLKYDQKEMIEKYHLVYDDNYLYLMYLYQKYRVNRTDGSIEWQNKNKKYILFTEFQAVMAIYDMLCFSERKTVFQKSGNWQPVAAFQIVGASPSADQFHKRYALAWNGRMKELQRACEKLQGKVIGRIAGADLTCQFDIFEFFPVLLQFWDGDEEFEPRIKILWDSNSLQLLHFETLYYIMGDLLERIHMEFLKKDE